MTRINYANQSLCHFKSLYHFVPFALESFHIDVKYESYYISDDKKFGKFGKEKF